MNASPAPPVAAPRPARLTRRAVAKQRTREKVLASAKQLFTERGFEGATIRDIADAAGMSTGAVFANFADKAELFAEILIADYQALYETMKDRVETAATVDEALVGMFEISYRFHVEQLPLLKAGIAASWTRSISAERRNREALRPILALIELALQRGIERGQLTHQADLRLICGIVWDVHLAGYRQAVFYDRSADDLAARLADQIKVILAGARA